MRHPTNGLNEDDLSRLTGSSSSSTTSSASTTPSHDINSTGKQFNPNGNVDQQEYQVASSERASIKSIGENCTPVRLAIIDSELVNNLKNSSLHHCRQQQQQHCASLFNSSYLPEFIDPLEWQKSRKRKERLDSTSSTTQDRKLIRSNSEELLPNSGANNLKKTVLKDCINHANQIEGNTNLANADIIIRRVSSEDFKRITYHDSNDEITRSIANERKQHQRIATDSSDQQQQQQLAASGGDNHTITNDVTIISNENDSLVANRQHQESSSPPYSPVVSIDMTRRSCIETSPARSHRLSPNRSSNGGLPKYHRSESEDSECENERRRSTERFCKVRAPPGRKSGVIKKSGKYLPTKMRGDENVYKYDLSALKYERRGFVSKFKAAEERNDYNDNNLIDFHLIRKSESYKKATTPATISPPTKQQQQQSQTSDKTLTIASSLKQQQQQSQSPTTTITTTTNTTTAEALPWDRSIPEDQTPILSRRYASGRHVVDCIDTAAKLSKVLPYPQPYPKQQQQQQQQQVTKNLPGDDDILEPPIEIFGGGITSFDNVKTRDVTQQIIPAMMSFQTPEERLKQVNKRLIALKKKVAQLEEAFEVKHGYRPSQAEKLTDKHLKNILIEISKMRKEKNELKMDPRSMTYFKSIDGMEPAKKLEKMNATLMEMQLNLSDKRDYSKRSESLEELTADQLIKEKTAVQHALLYFESMFGRPTSKEERDVARPLYDRYRIIKRMVLRSVTMSGCTTTGLSELPTILEHEAMVFESMPQQYSNSADDATNSSEPSECNQITSSVSASAFSDVNTTTDDSTTTTTTATTTSPEKQQSHELIEGLIKNATVARQQKQQQSKLGENVHTLSIDKLWEHLDKAREEKRVLKRAIRDFENIFEEQNGRKMLKSDRKRSIQETYNQYKEKKAQTRFLQALIRKHISR